MNERHNDCRKKIKKMVEYVNNNGKWTVVGWFRKGEIVDASTNDVGLKFENTTSVLHVSLLVPSKSDVASKTDETYRAMLIPSDPEYTAPSSAEASITS